MYLCANNEKQVQICIDDRNLLNNRYYMYFVGRTGFPRNPLYVISNTV